MQFYHHDSIRDTHPQLAAGALWVEGITPSAEVGAAIAAHHAAARDRLAHSAEGDFPEIQAWRRAFSTMGLKPTQYRCAAESLLRRFRKEDSLPALHPLVDLCNAVSLAFATPIAVFDLAQVSGDLVVRPADGSERYDSFGGEQEHPQPGEVIFADAAGHAHARRWCHRQSSRSAVRESTRRVLIVAEAMHDDAAATIERLLAELAAALERAGWSVRAQQILSRQAPRFEIGL